MSRGHITEISIHYQREQSSIFIGINKHDKSYYTLLYISDWNYVIEIAVQNYVMIYWLIGKYSKIDKIKMLLLIYYRKNFVIAMNILYCIHNYNVKYFYILLSCS